jgi:hypothetical protein
MSTAENGAVATEGTAVNDGVMAAAIGAEVKVERGVDEVIIIIMIIIMTEMILETLDVIVVIVVVVVVTITKGILTIPFIIQMTNTHQPLIPAAHRLPHRREVVPIAEKEDEEGRTKQSLRIQRISGRCLFHN